MSQVEINVKLEILDDGTFLQTKKVWRVNKKTGGEGDVLEEYVTEKRRAEGGMIKS